MDKEKFEILNYLIITIRSPVNNLLKGVLRTSVRQTLFPFLSELLFLTLWDVSLLLVSCRTTNLCLNLATEQDKIVSEKWLPELKTSVLNAQKCLEDCKYVRGLVSNNCSWKFIYFSLHSLHVVREREWDFGLGWVGMKIVMSWISI